MEWDSPDMIGPEGNLQLSQDLSGFLHASLKLTTQQIYTLEAWASLSPSGDGLQWDWISPASLSLYNPLKIFQTNEMAPAVVQLDQMIWSLTGINSF